jgi:putative membrane protein
MAGPWVSRENRFGLPVALAVSLGALGAAAQAPIPPNAPDFAMAAAQSDAYEIQAAHLALAQTQNVRVRSFAQTMIDDHTRTSASLRRAAMASHLPPPLSAMSSDQAVMLGALQSLRGADFDKAYAKQQVLAHDQALAVEQSYAQAGTDPNLRAVARSGAPLIQHHLKMAEDMSAALGES